MESIKIIDLKNKIFKRSALIPILNLNEILELNDDFSADEIMEELIRQALKRFEFYHPLFLEMPVNVNDQYMVFSRTFELKDNFDLYLRGLIDEDQITLIPNSIAGIRAFGTYPGPGNYFRAEHYERPMLTTSMMSPKFIVRGICNRPVHAEYTPDKKFTENSKIYWMTFDGVMGNAFLNQAFCEILEYIKNLKYNFQLPQYPIDMFGAVEVTYQQIKQELDQYHLQSLSRGELLM